MKNRIYIVATLAIISVFASCSDKDDSKKSTAPVAVTYTKMALQTRPIVGDVQLPGEMYPFQFVQLYPKINGFVKTVPVDRGSIVKQGQVLITLEAPEVEQEVAAAKL